MNVFRARYRDVLKTGFEVRSTEDQLDLSLSRLSYRVWEVPLIYPSDDPW